jgi:hypothetical protein
VVSSFRALLALMLGAGLVACGDDEPSAGGSGGAASSSGEAGAGGSPEAGARLPCPPGELVRDDGGCVTPGVPAEACGAGFVAADAGCAPVLPSRPCGPGQMAALGETSCRDVAPCTEVWGQAPTDGDTEYVDAAFAGAGSDGSVDKPWTSIGPAIDAAVPGAVVAIAAGTYQEALWLAKPVRLWGACPGDVSIEVDGAASITVSAAGAGSELHDLAVTGSDTGIDVVGAADVLLDRLWIHDLGWSGVSARGTDAGPGVVVRRSLVERASVSGLLASGGAITLEDSVVRDTQPLLDGTFGRGVSIEADAASGLGSVAWIRRSVVERAHEAGVLALGSQLTIEDTLVQGTQPRASDQGGGAGIHAFPDPASGRRSNVEVRRAVVAGNHYCGICATDSELAVEHTVVRDTLPEAASEGYGFGVRFLGADDARPERPVGSLRASLVDESRTIGVAVVGAEATIEATMVRDTQPRASDQAFGRGISVELGYDSARGSTATIRGVRIERSHELGLMVVGSEADIDAAHVRDTRPRASDGGFGVGLGFVTDVFTEAPASGTLRRSVIEQSHVAGLLVAGAHVAASDVAVYETAEGAGAFGDGVIATSYLVLVPGVFPTFLELAHATVEGSARAGLATFGAEVTLESTILECNLISLDGEVVQGQDFSLADQGDNVCACSGEIDLCRVESSGLEPPAAVSL